MKPQPWLPKIRPRDEKLRAAHGLTAKRDGWYKSLGGKTRYICKPCPVAGAVAALERKRAELATGDRFARVPAGSLTVNQLVEKFLAAMYVRVTTAHPKRMKRRTYDDYVGTLARFTETVGNGFAAELGPEHFSAFAKTFAHRAATSRRREIIYVERLINWAGPGRRSMNLIPAPNRGPDWIKPADDEMRLHAADSDKAYAVDQIKATFVAVADSPFHNAAAHLGLNCAFGPGDIGGLPESAVDLDAAVITFARGKTGVARLCPLVPETVEALRTWLVYRLKLKSIRPAAAGLFFRTREGMPYARSFYRDGDPTIAAHHDNLLTAQWRVLVGLPFSGLRSTFATIGDDWPDQRAVDVVLGHKVGHQSHTVRSRHYAKRISVERVRALVDYVWPLAFGRESPSSPQPSSAPTGSPAQTGGSPPTAPSQPGPR